MKPDPIFSRNLFAAFFALVSFTSIAADNPFADVIRKTEPLTGEQEQTKFKLPPGFEIQLVAAEPDIAKPMNMAFDAKGRLWITDSREYPFPAPDGKGRDSIKILEKFDANGRAKKITTFVDRLNIPIGLYPYRDGVIAHSIPNISYYEDTDADGRADKTNFLYGPVGFEKDTHGMTSAFRRGYDGWLYACHGFNNTTTLTGTDGSSITMNSGNTYRMRVDGSRVEQFTWGQVNPFGLAFDHLGNLYSADCHSSPIYQLIRGAHYPSFGKPHDGLGFAPTMMDHSHGSTAIGGIVFYADEEFPPEFRENFFVGNVMTCKINRDSIVKHGTTFRAKEEPDFLSCDDPWFRPVDLQLAPDGSIYVADFYNRIIGHYEVPLDNPGRDRERGRIWRIIYTGKNGSREGGEVKKSSSQTPQASRDLKFYIAELGNVNLTRRMLAMNEIVDQIGKPAIAPIKEMLRNEKPNAFQKIHGFWILSRLDALDVATFDNDLFAQLLSAQNSLVRVHLLGALAEKQQWNSFERNVAVSRLEDTDPHVRRAASQALGLHPDFQNIRPLLDLRGKIPKNDTHFLHTFRIALRNQLLSEESFNKIDESDLSEADSRTIADVSLGLTNRAAANFLSGHIQKFSVERDQLRAFLRHIARYADSGMEELSRFAEDKFPDDVDFQLALFKSVQEGAAQRGSELGKPVRDWGARLAEKLLASVDPDTLEWRNSPIKGNDATNPWVLQERLSADGKTAQVISSFSPGGEKFTGILRSKEFPLPAKLNFYLCGHDGSPEKPPRKKNLIRLRDADTGKVLMEKFPPRNDTAQLISWDLNAHAGKSGYLEIVDGNNGSSYAWIGVGRFDPPVVSMPKYIPNQIDKRQRAAAELAQSLKLTHLDPQLSALLRHNDVDAETRSAAAKALAVINPTSHLPDFEKLLNDATAPEKLRETIAVALAEINSVAARKLLLHALPAASRKLQAQIGLALASNTDGAEELLGMVEQGKASPYLLQENSIRERLEAAKIANAKTRVEKLVANLTPASVEKQKLIDERTKGFTDVEFTADAAAQIFAKNCAVCHQLDGQGALVGPQLDGVGNRGADRLIEDILDPNRNLDHAFRTTLIVLKDGDVQSGLFRREEGEMVVLADSTGKEISIPKKEIKERRETESSLMPDNFGDVMTPEDFNSLIAFLLAKGTDVSANTTESKLDFSEPASVLQKALEDGAFPGCAVAVGNDSGVVWSAAFGHFDHEDKQPVTSDTIYDLASLTKVVGTTVVYMRLSALGKINVTDRVEKFLPEFIAAAATEEEKAKRKQITIEQMLTHSGGIAGWKPLYRSVNSYGDLMQAIYKTPLESGPGEKFRYSDLGMMMLGEIASRVGGKKLPELERELVFDPLNMSDTMRNPPKALLNRIPPTERWPDREDFVHGIVHDENSRAGEGITGHAGLFSTTEDLSKLATELLRGLDGKSELFPKEVMEKFTRKHRESRGLGWGISSQYDTSRTTLSKSAFGHTGFTGTSIWIDPERKLFIILLSNRVHPTRNNDKIGRVRSNLADAVVRTWENQNP